MLPIARATKVLSQTIVYCKATPRPDPGDKGMFRDLKRFSRDAVIARIVAVSSDRQVKRSDGGNPDEGAGSPAGAIRRARRGAVSSQSGHRTHIDLIGYAKRLVGHVNNGLMCCRLDTRRLPWPSRVVTIREGGTARRLCLVFVGPQVSRCAKSPMHPTLWSIPISVHNNGRNQGPDQASVNLAQFGRRASPTGSGIAHSEVAAV